MRNFDDDEMPVDVVGHWIELECPLCLERVRHECENSSTPTEESTFSQLYGERATALWRKYAEQPNVMDEYDPNAHREQENEP